jgi:formyl-CoA transferase
VTRVLTLCAGEDAANDPRFQTPQSRVEHIDEVDEIVASWIRERNLDMVLEAFEKAEAAIGPAYNIAQIFEDPQYQARNDIVEVPDEELGPIRMTGAFPVLSETPAEIRHAGPRKGQHNDEIYREELGLNEEQLAALKDEGVI